MPRLHFSIEADSTQEFVNVLSQLGAAVNAVSAGLAIEPCHDTTEALRVDAQTLTDEEWDFKHDPLAPPAPAPAPGAAHSNGHADVSRTDPEPAAPPVAARRRGRPPRAVSEPPEPPESPEAQEPQEPETEPPAATDPETGQQDTPQPSNGVPSLKMLVGSIVRAYQLDEPKSVRPGALRLKEMLGFTGPLNELPDTPDNAAALWEFIQTHAIDVIEI